MITIFRNFEEIFLIDFKKTNTTVKGTYYAAEVTGKYKGKTLRKISERCLVFTR